jgi:quercetin dioxygenase-like cupin family protein
MRSLVWVSLSMFAMGMLTGALVNQTATAQHSSVKVNELTKADLAVPGKEASIFLIEIAPGGAVGRHYHPGDAFGYVLEGAMTLEIEGKAPMTLQPGQSGHVAPKIIHDDKNNGKAPLRFLVFHVADKSQPLAVPVK